MTGDRGASLPLSVPDTSSLSPTRRHPDTRTCEHHFICIPVLGDRKARHFGVSGSLWRTHVLTVTAPQPSAGLHRQQFAPPPPSPFSSNAAAAAATAHLPSPISWPTHVSSQSQTSRVGFLHGLVVISCPLQLLPGFRSHPHPAVFVLMSRPPHENGLLKARTPGRAHVG